MNSENGENRSLFCPLSGQSKLVFDGVAYVVKINIDSSYNVLYYYNTRIYGCIK